MGRTFGQRLMRRFIYLSTAAVVCILTTVFLWKSPQKSVSDLPKHNEENPTVKMIDRRGIVSSRMYNKFDRAIDSMEWGTTFMLGAPAVPEWGINVGRSKSRAYCSGITEQPFSYGTPNGNYIQYANGQSDFESVGFATATLSVVPSSSYGLPFALAMIDDDVELLEAKCEINAGNLHRETIRSSRTQSNIPPETTTESIGFVIVKIGAGGVGDVLGTLSSSGVDGVTTYVTDCTDLMQAFLDERNTSDSWGFQILPDPFGLTTSGNFESFIDSLVNLPTFGQWDLNNNGQIDDPNWDCSAGDPPSIETFVVMDGQTTTITWGGLSIGNVELKLKYPNGYIGTVTVPRFPIFGSPAATVIPPP